METVAMHDVDIALLVVGVLVLGIGAFSAALRRAWLSVPFLALTVGVVLGPHASGLLDPNEWGHARGLMEQVARLTLGVGVMAVALRLPGGYVRRNWRLTSMLAGALMIAMAVATTLIVWLIAGLDLLTAALIGAVLTPTDPILASAIVSGSFAQKYLPERLRNAVSVESGANDGLAYALVVLPILLMAPNYGDALLQWVGRVLIWEILAAACLGYGVGFAAGHLLEWAQSKREIDDTSFLTITVALSLAVLGGAKLIGTDGILAVFASGLAFGRVVDLTDRRGEERVQEAVNRFFVVPSFILLGMILPWEQWVQAGWVAPALIVAVLLLRRLPAVFALRPLMKPMASVPDSVFLGWFGPIGVAALYYACVAARRSAIDEVWTLATLVVAASIVIHGFTATPGTLAYARRSGPHA
jgi:NhaP-type Na+/H+ or K+/H+ antiporter